MKYATLLLLTLLSHTIFGQNDYKVTLPDAYANKYTISDLETIIPTYNRYLNGNVLSFSSSVNYEIHTIDSIFRSFGIVPFRIQNSKGTLLSAEKVGGTDCEAAEQLCSSASLPGNSGGFGIQELPNNNTIDGCLNLEHQSSWYYINIQSGGSFSMKIDPVSGDDYDFGIWGPFTASTANANCPPVSAPIRCSWAAGSGDTGLQSGAGDVSEDASGDRWVNPLTVSAGQVYILLVDNYSTSNLGYNIDFSWAGNISTAVIGCVAVTLPVEISSFQGWKENSENILRWTTESETNNNYFIIESSTEPIDGKWNIIGQVNGAGTTTDKKYYAWDDFSFARNQINYYRITQFDFDGSKRVYSNMVVLDNRTIDKNIVKVVNLLGQEVDTKTPGIVIYCYDDGTTEKRYH